MAAKIAFITDAHIEHQFPKENGVKAKDNWQLLLKSILAHQVDLFVFGGDIGEESIYPYFFDSLKDLGVKYHLILGNHDQYETVKPFIDNQLATNKDEYFYTFSIDDFQYIFLDSSRGFVSQHQLDWLKKTIKNTDLQPIIFIHHPILKVNTRVDIDFPLANRVEIVEILTTHNTEIPVFCGHYHTEHQSIYKNINQFVTPSAAFQVLQERDTVEIDTKTFGYRLITLDNKKLSTKLKWFGIA